ncbi:glycosyltransferase [Vibrio sp. THAF190c]|uniref:glycosyltransferase n=1 Tax=Vibrio sp. THAF190c TaxID=2587865 RepID=UPI0012692865|nr:glycosyltransferase [Vibrio sp. THAF190c]QFT08551.1 Putative glycosyltransferase EpsH [Vibrio sp. THAF190c]
MNISVIIAVYNQQTHLERCVKSVCEQTTSQDNVEILIIDDCSTDKTPKIISDLCNDYDNVYGFKTDKNGGPGAARNLGLENARGKWILFLDSDDSLAENAIDKLLKRIDIVESNLIESQKTDLIAYDFKYDINSDISMPNSGRTDLKSLTKDKSNLIKDYLSLKMDGSVIYTLIKNELLKKNKIIFADGYHEDIDFIYKAYVKSNNISILKEKIYLKNNREESIVNSITSKHISGLFRAYLEMYNFHEEEIKKNKDYEKSFFLGVVAIIATRIRQIASTSCNQKYLYQYMYDEYNYLLEKIPSIKNYKFGREFQTKYIKIFKKFIRIFKLESEQAADEMNDFMHSISKKSWSCYDLHNGLYLSSDEIRTCCKRFFVDGEMKGDVALLTPKDYSFSEYTIDNIFDEKKKLFIEINKGESKKCTGCDFLEFREWEDFKLEHISFEYHSVCNMKCTYCSDTYYGGKKNQYNIEALIDNLIVQGHLDHCKSIVWGGGEPTLGDGFESMLNKMNVKFPSIQQRVISNATKLSDSIKSGLDNDSFSLVTSIDAGNQEKFFEVRKNKHFDRVLKNLREYSEVKPENITIKYIFLDNNSDIEQVESFVDNIVKYGLVKCNFQISYDFNKETISEHTLAIVSILYGLLSDNNVPLVFLDDLLRLRIKNSKLNYDKLYDLISKYDYPQFSRDKNVKKDIVIWGAGRQTIYLLKDKHFMSLYNIKYLVDNTPSKIGTQLFGYDIYSPDELSNRNEDVLISAVQYSAQIKKKYISMGLDESRIVKDLIL